MDYDLKRLALGVGVLMLAVQGIAWGQEKAEKGKTIELGDFKVTAPAEWQQKQPKSQILSHEFAAPAAEGDKIDGRLTVMQAGGSIEANIDRWYGQFTQPDGGDTKERAKVQKRVVAGQDVHVVDISGTYKDQAGPFAPAVERPKYRMLAAIVATDKGNFFLKFYGPERTMAKHEKAFTQMIDSLGVR